MIQGEQRDRHARRMMLVPFLCSLSCGGGEKIIGEDREILSDASECPDVEDPSLVFAQERLVNSGDPSRHAGVWLGHSVGQPTVPDFVLTIDTAGSATLVYGDEPPPAPPTDGEVGYLCEGYEECSFVRNRPILGFSYAIGGLRVTDARLQALYRPAEPWDEWCNLQLPYNVSESRLENGELECTFSCLPLGRGSVMGDVCVLRDLEPPEAVDCGQFALCQDLTTCLCTKAECHAHTDLFDLDLTLLDDDKALIGKITGYDVLLQRAEP